MCCRHTTHPLTVGRNLKEEEVNEANPTFLAIFYLQFYDIRQALCVKSTLRSATDKNLSEKDDQAKIEQSNLTEV